MIPQTRTPPAGRRAGWLLALALTGAIGLAAAPEAAARALEDIQRRGAI